mmetsp:Transcript_14016/g.23940  ORF Transcript_14016/g.23940 Transcript_14016/m.23940 type:complete len:223 (-) Transcript_14016:284-952(-)
MVMRSLQSLQIRSRTRRKWRILMEARNLASSPFILPSRAAWKAEGQVRPTRSIPTRTFDRIRQMRREPRRFPVLNCVCELTEDSSNHKRSVSRLLDITTSTSKRSLTMSRIAISIKAITRPMATPTLRAFPWSNRPKHQARTLIRVGPMLAQAKRLVAAAKEAAVAAQELVPEAVVLATVVGTTKALAARPTSSWMMIRTHPVLLRALALEVASAGIIFRPR